MVGADGTGEDDWIPAETDGVGCCDAGGDGCRDEDKVSATLDVVEANTAPVLDKLGRVSVSDGVAERETEGGKRLTHCTH